MFDYARGYGSGVAGPSPDGGGGRAPGRRTLTMGLPARGEGRGADRIFAEAEAEEALEDAAARAGVAAFASPELADPFWFATAEPPSAASVPLELELGAASPSIEAQRQAARAATAEPATALPYADQLQRAFGGHDLSGIQAHVGGAAAGAASAIGAAAFACGEHVVLQASASLHTVAHEVAHVIQQRGGLGGGAGEAHERQADAVADRVVAGGSVEDLLGPASRSGGPNLAGDPVVQRMLIVGNVVITRPEVELASWTRLLLDHQLRVRGLIHRQETHLLADEGALRDLVCYPLPAAPPSPSTSASSSSPSSSKPSTSGSSSRPRPARSRRKKVVRAPIVDDHFGDLRGPGKGGARLIRRPSYLRSDSTDRLHRISGSAEHAHLRGEATAAYDTLPHKTDSTNVFAQSISFSYRLGRRYGSCTFRIPRIWNSAIEQQCLKKEQGYAGKAQTREQLSRYLMSKDFKEQARQHGEDLTLNVIGEEKAFSQDKRPGRDSSYAGANATAYAHSETAAAAHADWPALFRAAFAELERLAEASGGQLVLLTTTVNGDSFPNSVCTNACRIACREVSARLDHEVKRTYAQHARVRLSGNYVTDTRVTSARVFMPSHNHPLRDFVGAPGEHDAPVMLSSEPAFLEVVPDGVGLERVKARDDRASDPVSDDQASARQPSRKRCKSPPPTAAAQPGAKRPRTGKAKPKTAAKPPPATSSASTSASSAAAKPAPKKPKKPRKPAPPLFLTPDPTAQAAARDASFVFEGLARFTTSEITQAAQLCPFGSIFQGAAPPSALSQLRRSIAALQPQLVRAAVQPVLGSASPLHRLAANGPLTHGGEQLLLYSLASSTMVPARQIAWVLPDLVSDSEEELEPEAADGEADEPEAAEVQAMQVAAAEPSDDLSDDGAGADG